MDVKTCDSAIQANLIKTKLESEGITCFLANENFANLMPHYYTLMGSGVIIKVPESEVSSAQEVLERCFPSKSNPICPNCGSKNLTYGLGRNKMKKWMVVLMSIFVFMPFSNIDMFFKCNDCSTEFRN